MSRPVKHLSCNSRQRLIPWLLGQLDGQQCPGVYWIDREKQIFRIPWKHGGKIEWNEKESQIFQNWAEFTGRYRPGDPIQWSCWKTRLRCALTKNTDIRQLRDDEELDGPEPFHVYQILTYGSTSSQSTSSSVSLSPEWTEEHMDLDEVQVPLSVPSSVSDLCQDSPGSDDCFILDPGSVETGTMPDEVPVSDDDISPEMRRKTERLEYPVIPLISPSVLVTPIQGHEMLVFLHYRGTVVHHAKIDNPHGCRIYYGTDDYLGMEEVYGSHLTDKLSFPDYKPYAADDVMEKCMYRLLNALDRGLTLTCKDGDVYATRKCKLVVFVQHSGSSELHKLDRQTEDHKVFDFNNYYMPAFENYRHNGGMIPKAKFTITFGQTLERGQNPACVLISATIVPLFAFQMLQTLGILESRVKSLQISDSDECDKFVELVKTCELQY